MATPNNRPLDIMKDEFFRTAERASGIYYKRAICHENIRLTEPTMTGSLRSLKTLGPSAIGIFPFNPSLRLSMFVLFELL